MSSDGTLAPGTLDGDYETVIGLEVHVQLATDSKIFCGCSTAFGQPPNSQICPVCTGQPGVLPVLNHKVVDFALRLALALNCTINQTSRFARKNYFYPDLPKGYQISQFDQPLAVAGSVAVMLESGALEHVRINRLHLEEDAGKNIHVERRSLVDMNRAGVPLCEIVSEPDLRSPEAAAEYMRTLRGLVRALGVGDGNLEQGSLRCDANVSIRRRGASALGTRTEIKNINSFRFVQKALHYEASRQLDLVRHGEAVVQETRLWDADRQVTESMRSKEEAHDYRYFPEPDLPPLCVDDAWLAAARAHNATVELPTARRARFMDPTGYGLSADAAAALCREHELDSYFEATVRAGAEPKQAANWLLTELLSRINDPRETWSAPVTPAQVAELLTMVQSGKLTGKLAKVIWPKMWDTRQGAQAIAEAENLFGVSDSAVLEQAIERAIAEHPEQVAQYRAGKTKVLGFFVGQIMKQTRGRADPAVVNALLLRRLSQA